MIGRTLADRYHITAKIGQGGMGIVYQARDLDRDVDVAVKTLPPEMSHNPQFLRRFRQEAKALGALDHPNIVKLLDTFEDNGAHFTVMEFMDGQSLSKMLSKGALSPEEAQGIVLEVCAALSYAHEQGIVHRDIKPSNIMVSAEGEVKIMDFGIARILDDTVGTLTGTSLGSPEYMSPEQVRGQKVDARSDLYSLGVVLYQMLTGRVPFTGADRYAIGYLHLHEEPESIQQVNPAILEGSGDIALCALAKGRDARYQTAQEFAEDLAAGQPSPEAKTRAEADWELVRQRKTQPPPPPPPPISWKTLAIALVSFLFLVTGGIYTYREMRRRAVLAQHYEQGLDHLQAGEWELAIGEFDRVLQMDPYYGDAADRKGEAEVRLAEEQRQQELARLLEGAKQAIASDNWEEAIRLLERLREMDPGYNEIADRLFVAHYGYGLDLTDLEEFEEAMAHFDEALELHPDDAAVTEERDLASAYLEGLEAFEGENWQQAIASFSTVYDLRPDYHEATTHLYQSYCQYGDILLAACEMQNATTYFQLALAIDPQGTEAQSGLEQVEDLLIPRYEILTVASRDFSSTQGHNNWYYLESTSAGYREMQWNSGRGSWRGMSAWWVRWEASGGHPDRFSDAVRKWVSPVSGTLRVSGRTYKIDTGRGNGVYVSILKNSATLWYAYIPWYDSQGQYFNLAVSVQAGDALYFTINSSRDTRSDMTYFNPTIELLVTGCSE
jgi:tetratricopeptide (TPR) repeat protein/predicted Ser/Thr protein kinase